MALLQTVCPSLHPALDSNIPLVSPALCSLLDHHQHWLQVAAIVPLGTMAAAANTLMNADENVIIISKI